MTPALDKSLRKDGHVARTRYADERRVFETLKRDCSRAARKEYELAVKTLVELYNTTIHENRFVVGGAVEVFTYALLRSVDIDCTLCGDQTPGGDILLSNGRMLSLKSNFRGLGDIRLLNKMGTGDRVWDTVTLFVISGVGIVFGAPDMVAAEHLKATEDAKLIKKAGLQALIDNEDQDNVFRMAIAEKPPTQEARASHKASTAVAEKILSDMESQDLYRALPRDRRRHHL